MIFEPMAINQGMRTLRVSGAKKVTEGITSADEVLVGNALISGG